MIGTYKIADQIVRIESIYPRIHAYCKGYEIATDAEPASESEALARAADPTIVVTTTLEDIAYEKAHGTPDYTFTDDYYEELAVHRKLSTAMLEHNTFLFHGSCIAMDGEAYIFTAPSGTGKSTHARLWREYFGDKVLMVNDDKPYIRVDESGAWVYGTPFNGKHRLATDICVPIKAICLLNRGEKNEIKKIEKKDAYPALLQQTYRPQNPEGLAKTLALLDRLTFSVELYTLNCNMEKDAARVSYEGMHG